MSKRLTLESATNVAIILAALAMVATAVRLWTQARPAPQAAVSYAQGDMVPELAEATRGLHPRAQRTVLVFVNSGCHYCSASMPFYEKLQAASQAGHSSVPVVFVSRESPDTTRAYLAQHGITSADAVALPEGRAVKLQMTPTVILVDSNGRVLQNWTGQQRTEGEDAILDAVLRGVAPSAALISPR